MAREWHLKSRPVGIPTPDNFVLAEAPLAPLQDGEVRVRNSWLSVDPAMRVQMEADTQGYIGSYEFGQPLRGGGVGEVIESRTDAFLPGDKVQHLLGWRDIATGPASAFRKIPHGPREQLYLHHLGVVGFTAYIGLVRICEIKAGQTIFISAAGGSVGSAAVQIAKLMGLKVIGSAGGPEKCAMVLELGADAAIDYKAEGDLEDKVRAAAPDGIDAYFDNVGGDHLDAALALANPHARFALCGMVGQYNAPGPLVLKHGLRLVTQRIMMSGLQQRDWAAEMPEFRKLMERWIASGAVRSIETVREGLESVPSAFAEMFEGGVMGKMLIRLAPVH